MKKLASTLALASVLAVGSASVALAAQPDNATGQGSSISEVAKSAEFTSGLARGQAVSAQAKLHGAAVSAQAKLHGDLASAAGKANGGGAADAGTTTSSGAAMLGQAIGAGASEPGRLKAAAGLSHRP